MSSNWRIKRPTMQDIAEVAGVSANTVSRALADKPDIREETKARIRGIAEEMGYTRDAIAGGLRRRTTKTVGVIVSDNANPYFAGVIKGIGDVLRQNGYQMMLCNTQEDPTLEKDALRVLLEKRMDGLLVVPVEKETNHLKSLLQMKVPVVFMCRKLPSIRANYVVNDDVLGGYLAAKHISSYGSRPIFALCGPAAIANARDRLAGFKKAMSEAGLQLDEQHISYGNINPDDGYKNMATILKRAPVPASVLCYSDYVAMGALGAIRDAGLSVPEDVIVVGYDDIEFVGYLSVPLTTINHPRYSIGKQAAELLVEIMEGRRPADQYVETILKPTLVVRRSSCIGDPST